MKCPLCLVSGRNTEVCGADKRRYYLCENCSLIFADPRHRLSTAQEKARYEMLRNSIDDDGYVNFLNNVINPMLPYLHSEMRGLDYGCGPGPTLSRLVSQQGIVCEDYDPFFANRTLQPPYDFVFSTECLEHFHNPDTEIQRICDLLKTGGLLGIMTERWTTLEAFASWHYTQDHTHVSFYHADTFDFMCGRFGLTLLWQDESRVVILQRTD